MCWVSFADKTFVDAGNWIGRNWWSPLHIRQHLGRLHADTTTLRFLAYMTISMKLQSREISTTTIQKWRFLPEFFCRNA
jgi:hypothetical protein